MTIKNNKGYSYPDELQSLRVKQMESIAESAGFSNPGRVAANAEVLRNHPGASCSESFQFEPTRHNEGFRYAQWTLNNYKLSLNDESGICEAAEITRKDWEIRPDERKIARIALGEWEKSSAQHLLPEVNDNLVSMYTHELRKIPLLSAEEEVELSKQIEAGLYACHKLEGGQANCGKRLTYNEKRDYIDVALVGKDAFDRFYRANLPLVVSVAKRYAGMSMPLIDIIQEGNLGLWHAIEKFDYKKGFKFSTYATKWINQAITHSLPQQTSGLSLSEHVAGSLKKLKLAWNDYEFEYDRKPSIDTLVEKSGLSRYVVEMLYIHVHEPLSIYGKMVGDNERDNEGYQISKNKSSIISFISANEDAIPENSVEKLDIYSRLWDVIASLEVEERVAIIGRFGLGDSEEFTLDKIGDLFGVKRAAAVKKIDKILEKMRVHDGLEGL